MDLRNITSYFFLSYRKNNKFSISSSLCNEMGLSKGDRIIILEDMDSPGDIYLERSKTKDGAILFTSSKNGKSLHFSSNVIAKKFASLGISFGRYKVIQHESNYYNIITKKRYG